MFQSCEELEKVTIGPNVEEIGAIAFMGCTKLTSIEFKGAMPPKLIKPDAFENVADEGTVYYPEEATEYTEDWLATIDGLSDWTLKVAIYYSVTVDQGIASPEAAKEGDIVIITANSAPEGQVFDKWEVVSGTLSLSDATQNPLTFKMPAENITVEATYKAKPKYQVTVSGSQAFTTGTGSYKEGDKVNIYAGDRSGYSFKNWTASDVTFDNANNKDTYFIMLAKDVEVTANWTKDGDDNGGGTTPSPSGPGGGYSNVRPDDEDKKEEPKAPEVKPETTEPSTDGTKSEAKTTTTLKIGQNTYTVTNADGTRRQVTMDAAPIIKDGRTLMPARFVADILGVGVNYDNASKKATFTYEDAKVELTLGQKIMIVNGQKVELLTAPTLVNGRILLPLRDIQQAFASLGIKVTIDWNAATKEITIAKY